MAGTLCCHVINISGMSSESLAKQQANIANVTKEGRKFMQKCKHFSNILNLDTDWMMVVYFPRGNK
jgi:hypothetical protein